MPFISPNLGISHFAGQTNIIIIIVDGMVETYSPNDMVHIEGVGFCQLISCGKHKTLKFKKKPLHDDALKPLYIAKQKQSLYFDPESFLFEEAALIVIPPESVPIALPDAPPQSQPTVRRQTRPQQPQPQDSIGDEPNIITAKLYKTEYLVYTPDSNLSQHIQIKVKTMFCNRQQFTFYININSTILQLKNKVIELSREPATNLDNIRLFSTNGHIQEFSNNKELIYQTKITNNCRLLLLANVRFSIDDNQKGDSITLSNNNRTVAKTAQEGKYEMCLATIDVTNGKVYFETKIDKISEEDDLFIGVAKRGVSLSIPINSIQKTSFWGYNCMAGRKVAGSSAIDVPSQSATSDFGPICKSNDNIGTLIQVHNKIATLSYYVNGKFIGKAISNIECPVSPAVILGVGEVQVTINCLADAPFDAANYLN